ncbi:MAG: amidophosphoribosyltransferase [Spirochaetia bacterium]|nr:amidophosphoribosyltransferase [Spirochaetia bacterium]
MFALIKKLLQRNKKYYPKEECGIVGIFNVEEAANFAYLGIYALQHRGQESAGIVTANEFSLHRYAGMGKVTEVFKESKLKQLIGNSAIAHNRYSTTGASFLRNAQPIRMESRFGSIALAHNGNLSNAWSIRQQLENEGSIFQSTIDTEIIFHLMAKSKEKDLSQALMNALSMVKGAYSLVMLTKDTLYAARDPNGFRPLVIGKKDDGIVFASETCALDIMDAEYVRDVEPGEFIKVTKSGVESLFPFPKSKNNMCIFEYIYFARPDSLIFKKSVYDIRYKLGQVLSREFAVEADMVISVPDSSTIAALGYSAESGIPYHMGLIRSHYIGRTFIEPSQKIRDFGAKLKYNSITSVVKGKRIIVVDDSIMRGTTQRKIIKMLRKAGAKEIHIRISSPPTMFPCYFGIDIPTKRELIAATHTIEEIHKYLQVDSLAYISHEGMLAAAGDEGDHCSACFTGNYPINVEDNQKSEYQNQKMLFDEYGIEENS